MDGESRLLLGGDYQEQGGRGGSGGGVPMNLAMAGRGMYGAHRTGEGSGSDGQEEINVEDDGPVHPGGDSGALPSHLRPDDGGCSSSDDSRKVRGSLYPLKHAKKIVQSA